MLNYGDIGKRIRQLRKEKNLSQEQLAEQVWISTTHMSHIETGATKLSLPVLVDIANALAVGVDTILGTAIEAKKTETVADIQTLLKDCTPQQVQILERIVVSAKEAMDMYM